MRALLVRGSILFVIVNLLLARSMLAQTATVSLGAAGTVPGGTVTIPLTLSGTANPAAIEWTFAYTPDITNIWMTDGPSTVSAAKSTTCSNLPGKTVCVLAGLNQNTVLDGVVANISLTVSSAPSSATIPVQVTGTVAASGDASALPAAGIGNSILIIPPRVGNLACAPTTVLNSVPLACTVMLDRPSPAGGTLVAVASDNTNLSVPASVTVPAGSSTATFNGTVAVITGADQPATITASANSSSVTASVVITRAPQVTALTCTPSVVVGANAPTCTVTLDKAPMAGGATISLTSNNANVAVQSSILVPSGSASAVFSPTVLPVIGADQSATLSATLGGATQAITLVLTTPAELAGVTCPTTLFAGAAATCTLALNKAAAGAVSVALSSSNANLIVPSSVTMAAGLSSTSFAPAVNPISGSSQPAVLSATLNSIVKTASLMLTSGPGLSAFGCEQPAMFSPLTDTCTVTLDASAPAGGALVQISSTTGLSVPAVITIPAGSSSARFESVAGVVTVDTTVTLTATLSSQKLTTAITVQPPPIFYFQGTTAELAGSVNGSTVTPRIAPGGITGRLIVRGGGYVNFLDVEGSNGISFHLGGQQNTNIAFTSFTGTQVGKVFKKKGEISASVKSMYSFAERQALPAPNQRFAFDVFDGSGRKFSLSWYTAGGRLSFAYTAGVPALSTFTVPPGQEDVLFGRDVLLKVRITWDGKTTTLYLNEKAVARTVYPAVSLNWPSASSFIIGAQGSPSGVASAGFFALDDAIAGLEVR